MLALISRSICCHDAPLPEPPSLPSRDQKIFRKRRWIHANKRRRMISSDVDLHAKLMVKLMVVEGALQPPTGATNATSSPEQTSQVHYNQICFFQNSLHRISTVFEPIEISYCEMRIESAMEISVGCCRLAAASSFDRPPLRNFLPMMKWPAHYFKVLQLSDAFYVFTTDT